MLGPWPSGSVAAKPHPSSHYDHHRYYHYHHLPNNKHHHHQNHHHYYYHHHHQTASLTMSTNMSYNPTYDIHNLGGRNVSDIGLAGGGGGGGGGGGMGGGVGGYGGEGGVGGVGGDEEGYSVAEKAVIGTMLTVMVFVAVVGNLLVCAAVFTDRRLKRNSNFFIVSLAIADLLVALVVMTFAIANDIHGRWVFGAVFCRIWISSDIMCSTASILNLCVISLDRYVHIRDPMRYEAWMTTRKMVTFIATVWVLSVLISFVPTHLGWHESPSGGNSTSDNELCIFDLNPIYAVVSSTISFYIPCIVMVSIYVRLYTFARRHAETIRRTHTAERFNGGSTKGSYKVSDHKAAVTLGIIMGVFLLCWVPFFIVNPIAAFCSTCIPKLVFQILTWCGYVNSCLNPIIYSIFNTEFRDAFRRILFPKCFLERRSKNMYAAQHYTSGGTSAASKSSFASTAAATSAAAAAASSSSASSSSAAQSRSRAEYLPPLTEANGANMVRRNSREKLFADKVTSL